VPADLESELIRFDPAPVDASQARRMLDVVFSGAALALLAPLFLGIAAAIKLEARGPVFFSHRRIGCGGTPFGLLKFRTMVPNADRIGGALTASGDKRMTRVGRWLRRSKLDELPQLVNILRGEMRFVGPRPEVERYVRCFLPEYARLLKRRPGITDPASVAYRHEEALLTAPDPERQYLDEVLPHKLALSLAYDLRRNVWTDAQIVLITFLRLFNRFGAVAGRGATPAMRGTPDA